MALSTYESVARMQLIPHAFLAAATFAAHRWSQGQLDASYAASGHPVDYFTGQTGFDATALKSYYAAMLDKGTLDVYWTTQFIDFGFIAATFCMGLLFCTFVSRLAREDSWGRRLGLLAGMSVSAGAISDAIENLWSFVMLSNPLDFADWLAIPYSSFAVLKFILIALGMALLIASIALAIVGRVFGKEKIG